MNGAEPTARFTRPGGQVRHVTMSVQETADTDEAQHTEPDDGTGVRIEKNDAFHLLQVSRRRAVLRYLLEQDAESFVMRDVAEAVAAWENDTTVRNLSSDERKRVYIALYQNHLPKLDGMDVIEYDQRRGQIEPRPALQLLAPYLDEGLDADEYLTLEAERIQPAPAPIEGVLALLSS